MHEVTHAIGTKEMENYVVQYASKHQDFAESLASLQKTYKTKNVNSEVLADISGKLFGTQEFINSLVAENTTESRTVIQKVYEGIQRIKNMFTAEGRYKNFVDKLERMWREAYQTEYNNLGKNNQYSIQKDSNGNRYVKVDTDQDIFEGIDKKDYNKIAKMYIQDYLLGNTTLANIDTAKIDNRGAKKYTNPGKVQQYFDEKMKLTPELKNVFEISEKNQLVRLQKRIVNMLVGNIINLILN